VAVAVALCMVSRDEEKRERILMRRVPFLLVILWNWAVLWLFLLFTVAFFASDSTIRALCAAGFLFVKYLIKRVSKSLTRRLDHPDFLLGEVAFIDMCATCAVFAMLLISDSPTEVFLLVVMDMMLDANISLAIVTEMTDVQRHLTHDLVKTLTNSKDDATGASALQELDSVCYTPRLVDFCGKLFFACTVNFLMNLFLGVTYLMIDVLPSCNWRYFFLLTNLGYLQGYLAGPWYVFISTTLHFFMFLLLRRYLMRTTELDILRMGIALTAGHRLSFLLMALGIAAYFTIIFVDHSGVDPTFQFAWPVVPPC